MAFQPAPACAQAIMRYGIGSSGVFTHANVLNFRKNDGTAFTLTDLQGLTGILNDWDAEQLDGVRHTGYSLFSIDTRGLDSAEAPYYSATVNRAGAVAGDSLPPNVAACVTMTTGLTGRSARGRMYIGGLSEVQQDGGALSEGVVTGINTACAYLLTQLAADERFALVVLSRFTAGAPRTTANPTVVTGFALRDGVLDTQRRRIDRLKV